MHFHYSLAHAERVLSHVSDFEGTFDLSHVCIQAWSNCREQGYHLESMLDEKALCIAQHRNTDRIIVYFGRPADFDLRTNHPRSEELAKKNNLSFQSDHEAAEWIARYLCAKS